MGSRAQVVSAIWPVDRRFGRDRSIQLLYRATAPLDRCDPAFSPPVPPTYAVTYRKRQVRRKTTLDTWSHPLAVGQPLPSLPVWLSETQAVTLT